MALKVKAVEKKSSSTRTALLEILRRAKRQSRALCRAKNDLLERSLTFFPELQDASDALVDALLADGAVVDGGDDGIEGLDEVAGTKHDVCASQDASNGTLGAGVLLGDGTHLHAVGDDDVLVAQFAAQLVLQDD